MKVKLLKVQCAWLLLIISCAAPPSSPNLVTETTQPRSTAVGIQQTDTPPTAPPTELPTPLLPTNTPEPTVTATIAYTPTPDIPKERVEVAYEDRFIRGTLAGDGDIAVILIPMYSYARGSWMPFAEHIATLGYTALAIDMNTWEAGSSTGSFISWDTLTYDVLEVIDFLKARGHERVVCMGASLGGDYCLRAALLDPNLAGVVIIAAPIETASITTESAATLLMPKLFVSGNEPDLISRMNEAYKLLPIPKEFKTISNPAHGTELLNTGDELRDILVDFLENLR